jgi:streptomycin 6-kinase
MKLQVRQREDSEEVEEIKLIGQTKKEKRGLANFAWWLLKGATIEVRMDGELKLTMRASEEMKATPKVRVKR